MKTTIEDQVKTYLTNKETEEPDLPISDDEKPVVKKTKPDPLKRLTYQSCQVKGVGDIDCKGSKCIAHIITRQDHAMSASVDNRLLICKQHEIYFNTRPIQEWFRYVKQHYPEKFEMVKRRYEFVIKEFESFMEVYNEMEVVNE
jgi:uncharacterized protein (DUF1786 family)